MKAFAVRPAARELGVIDHPEPRLELPGQALVRMLDVGVCGTDREIAAFQYGTPPPGSDALVIGHESLGRVERVGAAVTTLAPGELVVTMVRRPCPHRHCPACALGRQDFCVTGEFTERGIKGAHGFMTERIVDDTRWMIRVPPELREVGVLVEPLTIAEKALIQVREVQDRLPYEMRHAPEGGAAPGGAPRGGRPHRAVVIGAGPVGLLGAMALRAAGYQTWVYSMGLDQLGRGAILEAIGARAIPAESHPVDRLASVVGGIDLVYEAAGASKLAFEAMTALGVNGIFVFTGVPGRKGPVELDTDAVMRDLVLENQVVLGTVNAGRDAYEAAIRDLAGFMRAWPAATRSLITGRYPIERGRDLLLGSTPGIKSVVTLE